MPITIAITLMLIGILIVTYVESVIHRMLQQDRWNAHVAQAMGLLDCSHCGSHHLGPEDCLQWNGDSGSRGRHPSSGP